jgi:excisionase family DNA binding protein
MARAPPGVVGHVAAQGNTNEHEDTIDVRGAMAVLKMGRNAVYDACARGQIPHRRIGKLLRFSRTGLEAWLAGDSTGHDLPRRERLPSCGRAAVQEAK